MSNVVAAPVSLRIGPERHAYDYHIVETGVYRCSKGSDWAAAGQCLYLVQEEVPLQESGPLGTAQSGPLWSKWIAVDAPIDATAAAVREQGIPVFATDENAVAPGWHTWQGNRNRSRSDPQRQATGLSCLTAILTDS